MRITVTRRQYRYIRAAIMVKYFNLDFEDVIKAMMSLQCRACRKEHIIVKVMTAWYKR